MCYNEKVSERKLVLIDWVDSHSGRGWQDLGELEGTAEPLYCRSVGWIITRAKDCTVIVPHISGEKNGNIILHGCGDMAIPTKSILKITQLKIS